MARDDEMRVAGVAEEDGVASWDDSDVTPEDLEAQVMGEPAGESGGGDANELSRLVEELRSDINRLKSSSQRQAYEMQGAYQSRIEQLENYIMQLENQRLQAQLEDMPEEERRLALLQAQYQAQLDQMRQMVQPLIEEKTVMERRREAVKHFAELTGIPEKELWEHSETPDDLKNYVKQHIETLRKQASRQPPAPPKVTSTPKTNAGTKGILSRWNEMSPDELEQILARAKRDGLPLSEL